MAAEWNAGLYDSRHAFVWQMAGGVVEMLKPSAGERILDLGCGTGHLTAQIAAAGASVVGIDGSPAMIDEARKNYPGLEFQEMNADQLRFDAPFDAVFSNAVLHWIPQPANTLARVAAALRPGGRFVAEMGGKGNVQRLVAAFYAALKAVGGNLTPDPNPWYFPSIAAYASDLEQAGLEVTSAALIDRPTPLDDGEDGLRTWIRMFAGSFVSCAPAGQEEAFVQKTEELLRQELFHDGVWMLDCRRLRFTAFKMEGPTAMGEVENRRRGHDEGRASAHESPQ